MRIASSVAALSFLLSAACASAPAPAPAPAEVPITSARQLVTRMRDRWAGKYFTTMVFRQKNTLVRQDGGTEPSEWVEYQQVPGRLRIETLPADSKSGILFRDNRQFTFANGKQTGDVARLHPLLLLSADVYAIPVDTTVAGLAALHIDTTQLHRSTWDGRPTYVVGAAAGDTTSSQFWVDAERMLLLRLLEKRTSPQGRTTVTDYQFTYQDVNGVAVPKVITFLRDGRKYWVEEYTEVRLGVPLDAALFDPAQWADKFGSAIAQGS